MSIIKSNCCICGNSRNCEDIFDILVFETRCKKCVKLFKSERKNVKIKGVTFKVVLFVYYDIVVQEISNETKKKANEYQQDKYKSKIRKEIIFFKRESLNEIVISCLNKQVGNFILVEVL